ncbi:MAG: MATE family efflux transporter [Bacteroidales bacterium]
MQPNLYKNNLNIALPIILSLAGQSVVQMVDSIMVGRLGAAPLAAVSFAGAIIMNIMVFGIGLSISLTPVAGQFWARGEYRLVAGYFQNSIIVNLISSVFLVLILIAIIPLLGLMGQPPEVVSLSYNYYILVSISVIPMMIFLTSKQFMEGIGNTKIAMYITIIANLVNIILNYILIYGKLGAPQMGATGAGIATLISRLIMPVIFAAILLKNIRYRRFLNMFDKKLFSLKKQFELIKIGVPISGQMAVEFFSLSFITVMMGWIGTNALAANQIALTMINFTFMISNGIAGASTILVSHAIGMRDRKTARKNGFAGMHISLVFMGFFALIFMFFGEEISSVFTSDTDVIKIAGKIFIVVALFELFDGLQVTALGALRGLTDVKRPMLIAVFSYLFVSLPVAYVFGFVFNLGEAGLMSGFAFGLLAASVLFIIRFNYKTRSI